MPRGLFYSPAKFGISVPRANLVILCIKHSTVQHFQCSANCLHVSIASDSNTIVKYIGGQDDRTARNIVEYSRDIRKGRRCTVRSDRSRSRYFVDRLISSEFSCHGASLNRTFRAYRTVRLAGPGPTPPSCIYPRWTRACARETYDRPRSAYLNGRSCILRARTSTERISQRVEILRPSVKHRETHHAPRATRIIVRRTIYRLL